MRLSDARDVEMDRPSLVPLAGPNAPAEAGSRLPVAAVGFSICQAVSLVYDIQAIHGQLVVLDALRRGYPGSRISLSLGLVHVVPARLFRYHSWRAHRRTTAEEEGGFSS
jgi:hypothetical protein